MSRDKRCWRHLACVFCGSPDHMAIPFATNDGVPIQPVDDPDINDETAGGPTWWIECGACGAQGPAANDKSAAWRSWVEGRDLHLRPICGLCANTKDFVSAAGVEPCPNCVGSVSK